MREQVDASLPTRAPAGRELASDLPTRLVTTRGAKRRDGDYERRLDRDLLAEVLASFRHTPAHSSVCGATPFVEAVTRALVELGLPAASVRAERYGGLAAAG